VFDEMRRKSSDRSLASEGTVLAGDREVPNYRLASKTYIFSS
jgi:hypothetical protein